MTNLPNNFQERDESWLENPDAYGYIYETIDLTTGKSYIGQHAKQHFDENYFGSGRIISEKMKEDELVVYLIGWCYSKRDLDNSEKFCILACNTFFPKGYNLYSGGRSHGFHHEETKKLISEKVKEMYKNHQYNSWNKGKHWSEEQKEKIRKATKEKMKDKKVRFNYLEKRINAGHNLNQKLVDEYLKLRDDKDEPSYS